HRALAAYRGRQVTLESRVWDRLKAPDMSYEHIANANLHLSREIVAALQLGDMTLLGTEISWTEKLLLNYNMPPETLRHYLTAYYEAAREVLAEDGRPIVGWLEGICSGDES
ncbi:MAG: hypothetical protein KC425_11050, partial [Anaerolineales bacterium]|nr:hypothetical protein [Anaerolineales bacterium]